MRGGHDPVGCPCAEEREPEPVVGGELGPELGQRRHNEDARHGDEVEVPPAGETEEAVLSEYDFIPHPSCNIITAQGIMRQYEYLHSCFQLSVKLK